MRETIDPSRQARIGAGPLIALALLAILVVAGAIWLAMRGDGRADLPSGPGSGPVSDIDATRFAAYRQGLHLQNHLNVTIQGTVQDKDWAVDTTVNLVYVAEGDIVRAVRSNDGTEAVIDVTVRQARSLTCKTTIERFHVEPPAAAVTIFKSLPIPGSQFAEEGVEALNGFLEKSYVKQGINRLIATAGGDALIADKVLGIIDPGVIEGQQATARYRRGEGLVAFDGKGTLSREQEDLLRRIDVVSEAHLLPDLEAKPGQSWMVDARHLAMLIDPTMRAAVAGSVEFRRGPDEDDLIRFEAIGGLVELRQQDRRTELLGRWSPRGSLLYDRRQHIVVAGKLSGEIEVVQASKDHKLFEARWIGRPTYLVTIAGRSSSDPADLEQPFTAGSSSE